MERGIGDEGKEREGTGCGGRGKKKLNCGCVGYVKKLYLVGVGCLLPPPVPVIQLNREGLLGFTGFVTISFFVAFEFKAAKYRCFLLLVIPGGDDDDDDDDKS